MSDADIRPARDKAFARLGVWRRYAELVLVCVAIVWCEGDVHVQTNPCSPTGYWCYPGGSVCLQSCNATTPPPTKIDFSVPSLTCTDGTHTLPDGGFLKVNSAVAIEGAAQITGTCDQYLNTFYNMTQTRPLNGIFVYHQAPGQSETVAGTNGFTSATWGMQQMDTSAPGGDPLKGGGPISDSVNAAGVWTYRSYTGALQSMCAETPTTSSDIFRTINATTCQPFFRLSGSNVARLTKTTIEFYGDPAVFTPALLSALEDAVNTWQAELAGTGITLHYTTTACTSSPTCVRVVVDPALGACGYTPPTTADSFGNLQTPTIALNANWGVFSDDGRHRTLMHEIGHLLGMDNYDTNACGASDALMQHNFSCYATGAMHAVTVNDLLPAKRSLGGGTRTSCGF